MDLKVQYSIAHKLEAGYNVTRKYQGTSSHRTQAKTKPSKRFTVFDDIIKQHSKIPGVAKYVINPQTHKKIKITSTILAEQFNKKKQTYIDASIKRSSSLPSVGMYQIQKYDKLANAQALKQSFENKNQSKKVKKFRPTLFDSCNRDVLNVAPGTYNIRSSINGSKSPSYQISPQKKKQASLPKMPSPVDYHPIPSSFQTFQRRSIEALSFAKKGGNTGDSEEPFGKSSFGSKPKIKLIERSPGPIYNLSTQWNQSKEYSKKFNAYKSISLGPKANVYY